MLASWLQAPIRWLAQAASRPQELHLQKPGKLTAWTAYGCPANFTHDLCARQFFAVPSRCPLTRNFKEAVLKATYTNHADGFPSTLHECLFGNSGTLSASSHALSRHHVVSVQLWVRRLFVCGRAVFQGDIDLLRSDAWLCLVLTWLISA